MTASEINNKFDQLYDNASKTAPGLEMYEKSLWLTQAQKEIIKELATEVDANEKRRRELDRLIINKYINYDPSFDATFTGIKISTYSKIFELPTDVWYILQERVYSTPTLSTKVIPRTIDEYNIQIGNRFRRPSSLESWRLDVKDTVSTTEKHIVEILCIGTPVKYQLRYLKQPRPIILEELTGGYTIDGLTTVSLPEITSELHETIIKRAVMLAIEAYEPQRLQTKMAVTNKEN